MYMEVLCFVHQGPHTLILHWGPADYIACPGSKCVRAGSPQNGEPALNTLDRKRVSSRPKRHLRSFFIRRPPSRFTAWLTLSPLDMSQRRGLLLGGGIPAGACLCHVAQAGLHWGSWGHCPHHLGRAQPLRSAAPALMAEAASQAEA